MKNNLVKLILLFLSTNLITSCEMVKISDGQYGIQARDGQTNTQPATTQVKTSPAAQIPQKEINRYGDGLSGPRGGGWIAGNRDFDSGKSFDPSRYDTYLKQQERYNSVEIKIFKTAYAKRYNEKKLKSSRQVPW
jgi:hypothetical protein